MNALKGLFVLHAQANELIDVEKSSPIEPVTGCPPPAQAIGLLPRIGSARGQQKVAITQIVRAIALDRHDLSAIECFLQRSAKQRQEELAAQFGIFVFPVDIE